MLTMRCHGLRPSLAKNLGQMATRTRNPCHGNMDTNTSEYRLVLVLSRFSPTFHHFIFCRLTDAVDPLTVTRRDAK